MNIAVLGHSVQKEDGKLLVRQGGNRESCEPSAEKNLGEAGLLEHFWSIFNAPGTLLSICTQSS